MSTTTLVIGLALLVILLMLMSARVGQRGRQAGLMPLSDESRDRYLAEWDRIETRFLDAPDEAVREADALVMSVLRERRHSLDSRKLPKDVRQARDDASRGKGDRTEGMRRAILLYRATLEKMVGAPAHAERDGRREMA
jgi:hypothetical protein